MNAFDDMLDEFRALGGTADNVGIGQGALGRGLFAADPAKPVVIRVPENLLLDAGDVAFEQGRLRAGPTSKLGAREKSFLESYYERFSWGDEGRAEIARIFEQAAALPPDLRHALHAVHRCGDWFLDATDALVQDRFLHSRSVTYKGRVVMMPVVELANHGAGPDFGVSDGVTIGGVFPGEVLIRYSDTDAFGVFLNWGFASPQSVALSIRLAGAVEQTRLKIGRDMDRFTVAERTKIPVLAPGGDGMPVLSFLMIGHRQFPRFPRGIFYKVMRQAGFAGVEESFDTIHHANRMHFLDLLLALEGVEAPIAHTLRRMALYQLQDMSFCIGARDI